jgi:cytochrome c553
VGKKCAVLAKNRRAGAARFRDSAPATGRPGPGNHADPNPHPPTMQPSRRFLAVLIAGAALTVYGADAAANWENQCAKCHGADGKGDTKMGKRLGIADLTDAKVQAKFTDEQAFKAMKEGVKDKDGKVTMKPIEDMSDADMKALVPVVRAFGKK